MEKIDQIAMAALAVAVVAITLSSAAITWSISRTKTTEARMAHLEGTMDLLEVRYTNQTAWLKAHGIEVPE